MENNTIEMALLEPEERELVEFIYSAIPVAVRGELTADDILFVLDAMDDFLEEQGLVKVDEASGEMEYLDGEVDETEQLNYVLCAQQCPDPTHPGCRTPIRHRAWLLRGGVRC